MNNQTLRLLHNLLPIGTVDEVDFDARGPIARVKIGEITTDWLPCGLPRAGQDGTCFPPTKGEQVLIAAPGGDLNRGIILCSLASEDHPPASDTAGVHRTKYQDGTTLEYDQDAKRLTVQMASGGTVDITGTVTITGTLTVSGLISGANGLSLTGGELGAAAKVVGDFDIQGAVKTTGAIDSGSAISAGSTIKAGGDIQSAAAIKAGSDITAAGTVSAKTLSMDGQTLGVGIAGQGNVSAVPA